MEAAAQLERLRQLAGSDLDFPLERFDPGDDQHVDALAVRLLARFRRADDVEALSALFEMTQARLAGIAGRIVQDLALVVDPNDLVAMLFASIFINVQRRPPSVRRFLGWAQRSMRNQALNIKRNGERSRRWHVAYQRSLPSPADPALASSNREQAVKLQRMGVFVLLAVGRAFHSLTVRDRRALCLRELEGRSYREVAATLDIPEAQIGTVIRRARKRLEDRIGRVLAASPGRAERAVS